MVATRVVDFHIGGEVCAVFDRQEHNGEEDRRCANDVQQPQLPNLARELGHTDERSVRIHDGFERN
jgi:hypothetical protein